MFLAERLRKTRTPAGFVTNPSKQQPQKLPERYLRNALNSYSLQQEKSWRALARTLPTECPKKLVSSKENSCSNEMFLAERLRKTRTPAGFVTNPSKQQPQKLPERYLRNALNSYSLQQEKSWRALARNS